MNADIDKPSDHSEMNPDEQASVGVFFEMPRGFAGPRLLNLVSSLEG